MLDVRRMQVLRAVVTSGSVTAAAAHLGYTPSAISQQVAALEKEAGTALLERTGRGVRPTAAGQLLTAHAAIISEQVAVAETALADLRDGRTGRLAIRYFASVGPSLLAPAVARVREEHPGVVIDPKLTGLDDPLSDVEQGEADLALMVRRAGDDRHAGIRLVHLLDDTYQAVLPVGHPLAEQEKINLADLAGEPWVGSEPPGPCLEPIIDACAGAGFTPDFAAKADDYTTAQGFVAAGLGISLIPRLGLGARHPQVIIRRVCHPEPVRSIYVAAREVASAQPALHAMVRALTEVARGEAGAHEDFPTRNRSSRDA